MELSERAISVLGWTATVMGIVMYLSYIDQIALNLAGHKGSRLQPIATILNCTLWMGYALLKPKRDWPVAVANFPGVVLGAVTLATSL